MNKKILLLGLMMLIIIFVTGCCAPIMPAIGLAPVEEIEMLTLETFPVQVQVIARGSLPDPCTEIYQITQKKEDNTFFITIKTSRPADPCIQIIVPFEVKIPLNVYGLLAGTYTVKVNGVQGTFDLEIDNILSL
jgi:inhibitor of cysteine peptidase